jgi:hypothetical protein
LRLAGHPLELASEASHVSVGRPRDLVTGEHTRRVLDEQDGADLARIPRRGSI